MMPMAAASHSPPSQLIYYGLLATPPLRFSYADAATGE